VQLELGAVVSPGTSEGKQQPVLEKSARLDAIIQIMIVNDPPILMRVAPLHCRLLHGFQRHSDAARGLVATSLCDVQGINAERGTDMLSAHAE
jgi:hypothetical protein